MAGVNPTVSFFVFLVLRVTASIHLGTTSTESPPVEVECESETARCWSGGGLWHKKTKACFPPLDQGPCQDNQWFVINVTGIPEGTCMPRPCLRLGQLPYQGRCLEEAEAREMCWDGNVSIDATGIMRCGKNPGWRELLAKRGKCIVVPETSTSSVTNSTDFTNYTNVQKTTEETITSNITQNSTAAVTSSVIHPGGPECVLMDDGTCAIPIADSGQPRVYFNFYINLGIFYVFFLVLRNIS